MRFLHELYLGEQIAPKVDRIVKRILKGKERSAIYLIVMSEHPENMLDLIPVQEIYQKNYPKEGLRVVGLADNKHDAFEIVQNIIEESLEKTGSADVRAYLEKKWEG